MIRRRSCTRKSKAAVYVIEFSFKRELVTIGTLSQTSNEIVINQGDYETPASTERVPAPIKEQIHIFNTTAEQEAEASRIERITSAQLIKLGIAYIASVILAFCKNIPTWNLCLIGKCSKEPTRSAIVKRHVNPLAAVMNLLLNRRFR